MTVLLYTYTDWQAEVVAYLEKALAEKDERLFWIGRRSGGIDAPTLRNVPGSNPFKALKGFEDTGPLPVLDDPIAFEQAYLADYAYQMSRYLKGYGSRGHDLKYFHEFRDHFHLNARKFKRLLERENITFLLFFNMPHTAGDYLLYRVAESMGIPVRMMMVSSFENRFFSTDSIEGYGILNRDAPVRDVAPIDLGAFNRQVRETVKSYMWGTYRAERLKPLEIAFALSALLRRSPASFLQPASLWPRLREIVRLRRALKKRRRTLRELLSGRHTREYLDWIASLEKDPKRLPDRFVYVPLHFQPELTTNPQGGVFGDQALALEMLARALPEGVEIVAKENPMQGAYHREKTFADRLRQLQGVTVAHPSMSKAILEEQCVAVVTVTGTAGWESIRDGRPCICLGHAWYLDCPGIHSFDGSIDLDQVIAHPPSPAKTEAFLQDVVSRSHDGVVYEFFLKNDAPDFQAENFERLTQTFMGLIDGSTAPTFRRARRV